MNMNQAEESLLTRVRQARTSRKTTISQAEAVGVDLEGAYRIQAALGENRELKGYKFGLISPAKQAQMGISAPIYGRVYAEMLLESPVQLSRFIFIDLDTPMLLADDPFTSGYMQRGGVYDLTAVERGLGVERR